MNRRLAIAGIGMGLALLGGCADSSVDSQATQTLTETDLYFGMNKSHGGKVSAQEWDSFVSQVVTPRFPDGLTVEEAHGQWRGADQRIAREDSRVIILIYESTPENEKAIDEIRYAYQKKEDQESVMRVSHQVQVGF